MSSATVFAFGPFKFETHWRRLTRGNEYFPLTVRQFDLLHALVTHAGQVLSTDTLIRDAWRGINVTNNNLCQVIKQLRQVLDADNPGRYIRTEHGDGYRFVEPVTRLAARAAETEIDALLAPHRAFVGSCAALESLEPAKITAARAAFEQALAIEDDAAALHVGLANACVLQFETTRADPAPDGEALRLAAFHARDACRLAPDDAEAWATFGFVLGRTGEHLDAIAALMRSERLEPHNWRHQIRLSFVSCGEQRLSAACRALKIRPDAPFAHWLAATVFVARGALPMAEQFVDKGIAATDGNASLPARFPALALHWLKGLLCLERGDDGEALAEFRRELSLEAAGHLYSHECAANTWYAIGACELRRGDKPAARAAFDEAIARVPGHVKALAGRTLVAPGGCCEAPAAANSVDAAIARASTLAMAGDGPNAARIVEAALASAQGSAGWTLPIEPLLCVRREPKAWARVLDRLANRAL